MTSCPSSVGQICNFKISSFEYQIKYTAFITSVVSLSFSINDKASLSNEMTLSAYSSKEQSLMSAGNPNEINASVINDSKSLLEAAESMISIANKYFCIDVN